MQKKTRWIAVGLLSFTVLGALLGPYLRSEDVRPSAVDSKSHETRSVVDSGPVPATGEAPSSPQDPLTLSPAFNRYAEATDYVERTESLRVNLLASLKHIAQGLQVDDQARQNILGLIEEALDDEKTREDLAKSLADQLTEKDIETLSDLHEHPVSQKVQSREDVLMQQNSETMARFLEQYQDAEAFKLAQADSHRIIEELQLWQDTEKMFHSITNQLLAGLNQDKKTVSPELFQQTTATLLESQREALTFSAMYLYQDLSDKELNEFKEIYKNPAATKERQIVFGYFEKIFGHIGSSMGRFASQSQSTK